MTSYKTYFTAYGKIARDSVRVYECKDIAEARIYAMRRLKGKDEGIIVAKNSSTAYPYGRVVKRSIYDKWYVVGVGEPSSAPYGWFSMQTSKQYELFTNGEIGRELNIFPQYWR